MLAFTLLSLYFAWASSDQYGSLCFIVTTKDLAVLKEARYAIIMVNTSQKRYTTNILYLLLSCAIRESDQ